MEAVIEAAPIRLRSDQSCLTRVPHQRVAFERKDVLNVLIARLFNDGLTCANLT